MMGIKDDASALLCGCAAAMACLLTNTNSFALAGPPIKASIVPSAVLDFSMPPRAHRRRPPDTADRTPETSKPPHSSRREPLLSRSFVDDEEWQAPTTSQATVLPESSRRDPQPLVPNIHQTNYLPPLDSPPTLLETPPAPPASRQNDGEGDVPDSESLPSAEPNQVPPMPALAADEFAEGVVEPIPPVNQTPIDLGTALRIAAGENPQVGYTQQRIQEAYASLRSAEVLWLPSIRVGGNYNKHDGVLQDARGRIIENSRSSLYTGLGSRAVGTSSPAVPGLIMNFHLRDAIFKPRIAENVVGARRSATRATTNDILLETALAYLELLESLQIEAVAGETLANARQLAELTESFAESGEGLRADTDRAKAELSVRQIDLRKAQENVCVASVRLARLLSRDQSHTLIPREPALVPIELVSLGTPLPELVSIGLSNRAELAESQYLVGAAVERLRREKYAPLVPSLLLGFSYGGNGGSPSSDINSFGDRADFDAAIFWEVRNLGFGEASARQEARAQLEQTRWEKVRVMDQIASDVAEGRAKIVARKDQIALAQAGISAARDSLRRNIERIRNGEGLPIEALQAIQALDQAQRQYVQTIADYNRAQFRLHRALGWPVQ